MKSLILLSALVITTAWATSSRAETWTAKGKGTNFVLKISDDVLNYAGTAVKAEIPLRDCNRNMAQSLLRSLKGQLREPASFTEGEGIALQIDGETLSRVDFHSRLGMDFTSMDEKIQRLKVLDTLACEEMP